MKIKSPANNNYCATVIKIKELVPLQGCDNVQGAIVFGTQVIVGKEQGTEQNVLYFPVECKLSHEFLSQNNLYSKTHLNNNPDEKGYFEESGRIRCVKFRGHRSEGFIIPLSSLKYFASIEELATLKEGNEFDEINGIKICEKYVVPEKNVTVKEGRDGKRIIVRQKRTSRMIDGQFRLHGDTDSLRKNMHKIKPDDIISVTWKYHGTSFIVGRPLVKTKLTWLERMAKKLGINVRDTEHDVVYASRNVIRRQHFETLNNEGNDLWADIAKQLGGCIPQGWTVYGESVGYTKDGKSIQKDYDYGEDKGCHKEYIYKITLNNNSPLRQQSSMSKIGDGIYLSYPQIKEWCAQYTLSPVPSLYYGRADGLFPYQQEDVSKWQEKLLQVLENFLEKDSVLCKAKVPEEGIVVVVESLKTPLALKLKSYRFLEKETRDLDKGIIALN